VSGSEDTLADRQSFSELPTMDAGVSTKGLRVAGVPVGDDLIHRVYSQRTYVQNNNFACLIRQSVALFSWLLCDAQFFAELDQSCMKRDTTEGSCTELELELEHEQHELCCSILNSLHPVSDTHLRVLTYSIFSRSSAALLAGACWHVRAHEEPARAPVAISAPTRDTAQRPA